MITTRLVDDELRLIGEDGLIMAVDKLTPEQRAAWRTLEHASIWDMLICGVENETTRRLKAAIHEALFIPTPEP